MTKRDYELIAEAILETPLGAGQRRKVAAFMAAKLTSTNPRFDQARFIRACTGVDEAPHAKVRRQKTLRDNKARLARVFGSKV